VLGHSDPSLTANVYTDVAGLALHDEVAKLPWLTSGEVETDPPTDLHGDAHATVPAGHLLSFSGKEAGGAPLKKAAGAEELSHDLAPFVTSGQQVAMAARAGIEPVTK
jgi:hypothetical protein